MSESTENQREPSKSDQDPMLELLRQVNEEHRDQLAPSLPIGCAIVAVPPIPAALIAGSLSTWTWWAILVGAIAGTAASLLGLLAYAASLRKRVQAQLSAYLDEHAGEFDRAALRDAALAEPHRVALASNDPGVLYPLLLALGAPKEAAQRAVQPFAQVD